MTRLAALSRLRTKILKGHNATLTEELTLTVEHSAAPAMPTVTIELAQRADALALEVIDRRTPQAPAQSSSTTASSPHSPMSTTRCPSANCARCRVRTATLYESLAALSAAGRLSKSDQGYRLGAS